jgi:hypothetical protein
MSTASTPSHGWFATYRHGIASFFFDREIPVGMAVMRIVLPWIVSIDLVQRWAWVRELYSADGAPAPLGVNFGWPNFPPEIPGSLAVALFTAMLFLLFTSSIGWFTRTSLLLATGLYTYFGLLDCISTLTKYSVICTHLMILLSVSNCGSIWSVDAWLRRRRQSGTSQPWDLDACRFPVWPQRLVQLFLGVVYLGASITKMHTPAFFNGDQLMYWMMTYLNNEHPLGDWLSQFPIILGVFGYITIIWQIVFVFAVFKPLLRVPTLAIGAGFHLMTAFTLGLYTFPAVMLTSYLAFLNESDLRYFARHLRRLEKWWQRRSAFAHWADSLGRFGTQPAWVGAMSFALVLAFVSLAGAEVEHWMDPYGMRRPEGPYGLREISGDDVDRLFSREVPLRQVDKLLAFDLGKWLVGDHLVNRSREFRQGERIIAQASLSPPHEDMWIECIVYDTRVEESDEGLQTVPNKVVSRIGQVITRETSRGQFVFKLDEAFEPGEYVMRLRAGNEDVGRRSFTLLPRAKAPVAN